MGKVRSSTRGVCRRAHRASSIKASGEQLDDRVVEVHWDAAVHGWRMMRFRDDKPNGNHKSVAEAIIKSIAEGVEKDAVRPLPGSPRAPAHTHARTQLLARSNAIRSAWKTRQTRLGAQPPPPPAKAQPYAAPHTQPHPSLPPRPTSSGQRSAGAPDVKARFGPLARSPWSKVSGPPEVFGMKR